MASQGIVGFSERTVAFGATRLADFSTLPPTPIDPEFLLLTGNGNDSPGLAVAGVVPATATMYSYIARARLNWSSLCPPSIAGDLPGAQEVQITATVVTPTLVQLATVSAVLTAPFFVATNLPFAVKQGQLVMFQVDPAQRLSYAQYSGISCHARFYWPTPVM